jgi:hypothetical protein
LIIKQGKGVKKGSSKSENKEETQAEDILFTMFDEQEEAVDIEEEEIPEVNNEDHISEYLLDFSDVLQGA